jgi:hypothetical protein
MVSIGKRHVHRLAGEQQPAQVAVGVDAPQGAVGPRQQGDADPSLGQRGERIRDRRAGLQQAGRGQRFGITQLQ